MTLVNWNNLIWFSEKSFTYGGDIKIQRELLKDADPNAKFHGSPNDKKYERKFRR